MPWDAPPGGAVPPDPRPPHNTARRRGARHLPWEGRQRQRARGGTHCPAAHYPLTADPHGRPQPASAAQRRLGEQGTPARACTRVWLSQDREGRRKSATPWGRNHKPPPPRPSGGGARGPEAPPPSPPPQAQERTEADRRDGSPAPPWGGHCARGGRGHRGRGKRPR